jgi:hypothetical protein
MAQISAEMLLTSAAMDTTAGGSKSDHPAVLLETQGGERLILRRRGGPALGDRTFDDLIGQSIVAKGQRLGQALIVGSWSSCD